jgi:hypothetical protein
LFAECVFEKDKIRAASFRGNPRPGGRGQCGIEPQTPEILIAVRIFFTGWRAEFNTS